MYLWSYAFSYWYFLLFRLVLLCLPFLPLPRSIFILFKMIMIVPVHNRFLWEPGAHTNISVESPWQTILKVPGSWCFSLPLWNIHIDTNTWVCSCRWPDDRYYHYWALFVDNKDRSQVSGFELYRSDWNLIRCRGGWDNGRTLLM